MASKPAARETFGRGACDDCGAPVLLKLTINGKAYYTCRAQLPDLSQCNARHTYSAAKTADLLARAGRSPDTAPTTAQPPIEETASDDRPQQPAGSDRPAEDRPDQSGAWYE